jgi:hypothetical protein
MDLLGVNPQILRRWQTSALVRIPDSSRTSRVVRNVPKSDLCVDGDLGLTRRSEAALEPPRFSYAHLQAYICPSSSLVMVPGLHPDGVARLVVILPAVAVPGAARVVGPHA